MRTARLASLVVLAGAIAGGLVLDAADDPAPPADSHVVEPGVALPVAHPASILSSTWFCAGGTASGRGALEHVVLISNPTDRPRTASITVLTGGVAQAPTPSTSESTAPSTTTTTTAATTSTAAPRRAPAQKSFPLPAQSRIQVALSDITKASLAGAIVEVDGGQIVVEHSVTGPLGRATAPCATTASTSWTFPWGVTSRGNHELLVFMNPFPDDATVDIAFATDEGVRDTARFQGFVVPGQSVVGAFIDQDVTRKDQVSAQIQVRGGRLVVDRIQTFDGTDGREGMTLGLGVPTPAETWIFPIGETGKGISEQVVVFNPGDEVAEVAVEVRLDKPGELGPPEPFELTVPPRRYSIVNLDEEERVPATSGHVVLVTSLNGVPVAAERVLAAAEPAPHRGVSASSGSPFGAATWYFSGGGPTKERDEYLVLFNLSNDEEVTYSVTGFAKGQTIAVQDLQSRTIPAGGRVVIRLGAKIQREDLPVVISASGPIVAERGLYRIGGGGLSLAIGVPLDEHLVIPDPVEL